MEIYNTIVAQNSNTDIYCSSGTVYGSHNLTTFTGWTNSIYENYVYDPDLPLFINAASNNYSLAAVSQAIDKGNNAFVTSQFDIAGNLRIINGTVDIGAYEYQGTTPTIYIEF